MLHRMEGLGLWGFQGPDREEAVVLGRRALGWAALAGVMFLLCRVQAALLAPFGMAFLAAALLAGRSAGALLAGCLAGALGSGPRGIDLRLPIGAAIVLGGSIAREWLLPRLRRWMEDGRWRRVAGRLGLSRAGEARDPAPRRQARSPNRRESAACSLLAGLGVLLPGLAAPEGTTWPCVATAVAASVASVAAAPFFRAALEVRPGRRWLNPEERVGLFLLLGALTAGLARLSVPLALCVGCGLAQVLHPNGALVGVGLGGALLAMGADVRALALTAACGATAQLCPGLSGPGRAACACGGTLAAGLLLNAPGPMLLAAGASSLPVALMPRAWAGPLSRLACPAPDACDPRRLAVRLRRESASRLRDLSAAFGELAEGYRAPEPLPDEQALMHRLRDRLCAGCGGYEKCWGGAGEGGARLLCDLVARAVALSGEAPLFEGEAPPELCRRCRRGRMIPERIGELLEDFARARRDGLKRGAENRLISAQFSQARRLLEGLARRQAGPLRLRDRQAARAAAVLERAGIGVGSVMALEGRGVEIVAALKRGTWTREQARLASARLSRAFGRRYAAVGPAGAELRFVRRPRLRARTGILCASGQAGTPCGDSHLACMLDGERLLVLVSDGMGSGDAARRESAGAVRLLGRFLRAGAASGLAVETVNALLLNRGGDDMFATVDMLILDLSTGEAEFTKLAACPTLIAREGRVRRVEGGRLPLGILERVSPGTNRARLLPGDVLLMATDGVMDAVGEQALEALLQEGEEDMPSLARRALALAEGACEGGRRDDMTVVCLRVEER